MSSSEQTIITAALKACAPSVGHGAAGGVSDDGGVPVFVNATDAELQAEYGAMLRESDIGYLRLDAWQRVTFANPAVLHMLGVDVQPLTGRRLGDLGVDNELAVFIQSTTDRVCNAQVKGRAFFQLTRDDVSRSLEIQVTPMFQGGVFKSAFIHIACAPPRQQEGGDITQRRALERAMEEKAVEFRAYFLDSPLGMLVRDANFRILRVNAAYEALTGYRASELVGEDVRKLIFAEDLVVVDKAMQHFESQQSVISNELRIVSKSGQLVWVNGTVNRIRNSAGALRYLATAENITARKLFQQQLEGALLAQAAILDTTTAGVVQIKNGRIELGNRSFETMFGYTAGQLNGRHIGELVTDAGQYDVIRANAGAAFLKGDVYQDELKLLRRDGSSIWVAVQARSIAPQWEDASIILTFQDVGTSRQQRETMAKTLREHEVLFEMTSVGVAHLKQRIILRCNRRFEEMFGYGPGALEGIDVVTLYKSVDEYNQVGSILRSPEGTLPQMRHEFKRQDGSLFWGAAQANMIDPAKPMAGYITTVADVTGQQAQEDALKSLLREQQIIFDNALVGIALVRNGQWIRVNDAFCRMFGYAVDESIGTVNAMLFQSAAAFDVFRSEMNVNIADSGSSVQEVHLRRKDGSLTWCLVQACPVDVADTAGDMIFTLIDISAHKAAEQDLLRVGTFLDAVVENLPTVVAVRDVKSRRYLRLNRSGEKMTGRMRDDVIGKTPDELYPADVAAEIYQLDAQVIDSREIIETETSVASVYDGSTRVVLRKTVPVVNQRNEVEFVMSLAEDITDRVRGEQALRESETRFRQFAANINQVIFLSNPARTSFEYLNARVEDIWGISNNDLHNSAVGVQHFVVAEDLPILAKVRLLEDALQPADVEFRIQHPTKGLRWLRAQTFPKKSEHGGIRVFGLVDDITDRKDQEKTRIDQLIEQRDVLVREVHHRIKNNLQGVAGLLQHASRTRPALKQQLDEVSTQIQAIAQVHGLQLRAGQALQLHSLAKAIVDNLARLMPQPVSFIVRREPAGATTVNTVDQFALPESEAVPVALVLNELGTNALKHGRGGARVSMFVTADQAIVFEFENEGTLPAGFDYKSVGSHASGIGLIKALVPRRGGTVEYAQIGASVVVRLTLRAPAVTLSNSDGMSPTPAVFK